MFILDLYRFCESRRNFSRQDFARYVFNHREVERMARATKVTTRQFASMVSKECISRWCTLGYLNLDRGIASAKGPSYRPHNFEFESFQGRDSSYIVGLMNVGKLDDEELFGKTGKQPDNRSSSPGCSESDITRRLLECRAQLATRRNEGNETGTVQPD